MSDKVDGMDRELYRTVLGTPPDEMEKELRRLEMEMTIGNSEYIGDGVYAGYDGMGIWLHVGSHDDPTDKVYLEDMVFFQLIDFAKRVGMVKK